MLYWITSYIVNIITQSIKQEKGEWYSNFWKGGYAPKYFLKTDFSGCAGNINCLVIPNWSSGSVAMASGSKKKGSRSWQTYVMGHS